MWSLKKVAFLTWSRCNARPLLTAIIIVDWHNFRKFRLTWQMWWRRRLQRWTRWPTLNLAAFTETMLLTAGQITRYLWPIVEMLSLILACTVIDASHTLRTTGRCYGTECGRFRCPLQTMWILHFQSERRWTFNFGTVNTVLGAQTQCVAFVVELLVFTVFVAFVLAIPFAIAIGRLIIAVVVGIVVVVGMAAGWRWHHHNTTTRCLLVTVQRHIAEFNLAATVVRIGHSDTLLRRGVVHFWTAWLTLDLTVWCHTFTQTIATVFDACVICITLTIVQTMAFGVFGGWWLCCCCCKRTVTGGRWCWLRFAGQWRRCCRRRLCCVDQSFCNANE